MKILLTGGAGQLGHALRQKVPPGRLAIQIPKSYVPETAPPVSSAPPSKVQTLLLAAALAWYLEWRPAGCTGRSSLNDSTDSA